MSGILRKFLSMSLAASLAYVLYIYGASVVHSGAIYRDKPLPLVLNSSSLLSPRALLRKADALQSSDSEVETLALAALKLNPASGHAASLLLDYYDRNNVGQRADLVASLSSRLRPADSYNRAKLASYWLRKQRLDKVVQEWNVLLVRNASKRPIFYPALTSVFFGSETVHLLNPFIENPPVWWDSYFAYLSRNLTMQQLIEVYEKRTSTVSKISDKERRNFVRRLIKEQRWSEAYKEWFSGLTAAVKRHGDLVFDGGFETSLFNESFGWKFTRSKNPRIKTDVTYGVKGRRALHVYINKKDNINFRHVSQRLMLEAGSYELSMRFRTDTFKASKGLVWRLRCVKGGKDILGQTESFFGSNPWSSLRVGFTIPSSCKAQLLRLEAESRFRHEWLFDGSVWFDEIKIKKIQDDV